MLDLFSRRAGTGSDFRLEIRISDFNYQWLSIQLVNHYSEGERWLTLLCQAEII